jgi:tRNA (Thr-GGU) A37 N-methylase
MNDDAFGIRPGEVKTELPEKFDAGVYFIGRIHTPWTRREQCPKNARESDAECTIEVDARFAPALADIESCSHLLVLYWMDRSRRDLVLQVPRNRTPTLPSPASGGGKGRGTFALRSPARPHPPATSVARPERVEGNRPPVVALDRLDGTPLNDLNP